MALSTDYLYVGDSEGLKKYDKSGNLFDSVTDRGACKKVTVDEWGNIYALFTESNGQNTFRKFDSSLVQQWSVSSYQDKDDDTGDTVTRDILDTNAVIHVPSVDSIYYATETYFGEARIGRIDSETGEHYGALEIDNSVTGITWDARGYLWISTRTNSDSIYNVRRLLHDGLTDAKYFIDTANAADNNDPIKSIRFDNETNSIYVTPVDGSIRKYKAPTDSSSLTKEWENSGYFNESFTCESAVDENRAFYHGTGDSNSGRGVAKIDQSGAEVWHTTLSEEISEVAVDRDHSVYAISDNTVTGSEYVYKLDSTGTKQFQFSVGNEVHDISVFQDFECDPYAWRDNQDNPNYKHVVAGGDLYQFDDSGNRQFKNTDAASQCVTLDADGVIFGGGFQYVTALDNGETLLWKNQHDLNRACKGIDHHENGYLYAADQNSANGARILRMSERDGFVEYEYTHSTYDEANDVACARWDEEYYFVGTKSGVIVGSETGAVVKMSGSGSEIWKRDMTPEPVSVDATHKGEPGTVSGGMLVNTEPEVVVAARKTGYNDVATERKIKDLGDSIGFETSSSTTDKNDTAAGTWGDDESSPRTKVVDEDEDKSISYDKFNATLVVDEISEVARFIDQFGSTRWEAPLDAGSADDSAIYPSSSGHEFLYTSTPTNSVKVSSSATPTTSETDIPTASTSTLFDSVATATTSETLLKEISISNKVSPSTQLPISNTAIQADTESTILSPTTTLLSPDVVADADTKANVLRPDVFLNISDSDTQSVTVSTPNVPQLSVTTTVSLKEQLTQSSLQLATSTITATVSETGATGNSLLTDVSTLVNISNSFTESLSESSLLTRPIGVKSSRQIASSYTQSILRSVSVPVINLDEFADADTTTITEQPDVKLNSSQALPSKVELSVLLTVPATVTTTQERLDVRLNGVLTPVASTVVTTTSLRKSVASSKESVVDTVPTISSGIRESVVDPTIANTTSVKTTVFAGANRNTYSIEPTVQTFGDYNTFENV